jgi:uracil-DNA glycosylase
MAMPQVGAKANQYRCCHAAHRLQPDAMIDQSPPTEPSRDCDICPRLAAYRTANRQSKPDWFNAPVPGWGDANARLLVVGLAPGVSGANRTGRPFTGDYAGDLLYATLTKFGFTSGSYAQHAQDGFALHDVFISNAVRCVPPENKPLPAEIHNCRPFMEAQVQALPKLQIMVALGTVAHQSAVKAGGGKLPKYKFAHNAVHRMPKGLIVVDSYHCSRYNTNTKRLTTEMFESVFENVRDLLNK